MAIRSFALAVASQALSLGVELLGYNDESLGKILTVLSQGLYVLAALIFAWEWLVGRSTKPPNTAHALPLLAPTARDLTNQERLLMQSAFIKMLGSGQHEHVLDTVSLASDILYGRPTDGPCGICGKLRLRQ